MGIKKKKKNLYSYCGPVFEFEKIVDHYWSGKTVAVSEKQARNNLTFQFKCERRLAPNKKIILPGFIKLEEENIGQEDLYTENLFELMKGT